VENTWVAKDVDFGTRIRRWWFAACELDECPDWLKRGGGVSWGYHHLSSYTPWGGGPDVMTSALIREISVLSPGVNPAVKLARVAYVKEKPVAVRHHAEPEGEVIYGNGQLIRRYYDNVKITIR